MSSVKGGCACGAVRYECSADPIMAANCNCGDCEHSTGTAMASVLLVPKTALTLTGASTVPAHGSRETAPVSRPLMLRRLRAAAPIRIHWTCGLRFDAAPQ